jgi:pimeloyl-ACP methyl ester carboxylesterase
MPVAKVGDINMEYYVEGSGPPLLMIMGFGLQASAWGETFLTELRRHFRTIRFSNRGMGLTDKPDAEYTIRMMADDAAGLLEELRIDRAHVLGVSMGGMIAQELALNHPQQVQRLLLLCTTCGARGVQPEPEVVATMVVTPGLSPQDQIRKGWSVSVTPEFLEKGRDILEEACRGDFENPAPFYVLGRQAAAIMRFDTYERLPQIRAPTLVIHGDRDQLVPVQNARILHERIPNCALRIVPGAPHGFNLERPKEVAQAVIQFLSTSVPASA